MRPLADLVVVEHGDGVGVRYAGRLLGQFGARVLRPAGPGPTDIGYCGEAGAAYAAWLDEGKETGEWAHPDIVIVDQDTAATPNAPFVASLRWFPGTGPYAGWSGSDAVIQALAGHAHPFGPAEGPPAIAQGDTPQIVAAVTLCLVVMAGLIGRRAGSGPARVETSAFEAMMCLSEIVPMVHAGTGVVPGRRGINRFFPTFPGTCWQAADGWVGITTLTPAQWRGLCELCGLPEMGVDPKYATSQSRTERAEEIDAAIAPLIRQRPVDHWVRQGQARRVPFVAAPRPAQLLDDPHWQARGSFPELARTRLRAPRLPYRITPGAAATRQPALTPDARKPLKGLRVLDFSMGWSGPLATRHLGGLGAEIVKVESRAHPDWWRGWDGLGEGDPPPAELRRDWAGMNVNKRDVLLDLTQPAGQAAARRLVASSDVMIENFATGVIDKLGFAHDRAQEMAPGIVTVSMALFGAQGPHAGYRGYGSTTEQASGLGFINGAAEWPPVQSHVGLGDPIAGLYSAFAALVGIWAQPAQGGVYFDLSQIEALFQLSASAIIAEQVTGRPVPRDAACRPGSRLTRVVAAAGDDEWLLVDCLTEAHLETLSDKLGSPGDVEQALGNWAATRDSAGAAAELQAAGIPAGQVTAPHQLVGDPQLAATGFWQWSERRYTGRHLLANAPYRLDGQRPAIDRVAPVMGQDDDELLPPLRNGRVDA